MTDCAGLVVPTSWVRKVRLARDRVAFGPEVTPVPLKATSCGLPNSLSVISTEADRGPIWIGLKVVLILQLAPAGRLEPQVSVFHFPETAAQTALRRDCIRRKLACEYRKVNLVLRVPEVVRARRSGYVVSSHKSLLGLRYAYQ